MQIKCIFKSTRVTCTATSIRGARENPARPAPGTFDVHKDGSLRSERSLTQTIGRAARNLDGVAILVAEPRVRKGGAGARPVARPQAAGVRGAGADNVVSILGKQDSAAASVAAALS
jgi:hypothetical protein